MVAADSILDKTSTAVAREYKLSEKGSASPVLSVVSVTSISDVKEWSEAVACAVCGTSLGKRRLNPRHHCRLCGSSVCSSCSPSSIKLEGEKSLQRVCTPCVGSAIQAQQRCDDMQSELDLSRKAEAEACKLAEEVNAKCAQLEHDKALRKVSFEEQRVALKQECEDLRSQLADAKRAAAAEEKLAEERCALQAAVAETAAAKVKLALEREKTKQLEAALEAFSEVVVAPRAEKKRALAWLKSR